MLRLVASVETRAAPAKYLTADARLRSSPNPPGLVQTVRPCAKPPTTCPPARPGTLSPLMAMASRAEAATYRATWYHRRRSRGCRLRDARNRYASSLRRARIAGSGWRVRWHVDDDVAFAGERAAATLPVKRFNASEVTCVSPVRVLNWRWVAGLFDPVIMIVLRRGILPPRDRGLLPFGLKRAGLRSISSFPNSPAMAAEPASNIRSLDRKTAPAPDTPDRAHLFHRQR